MKFGKYLYVFLLVSLLLVGAVPAAAAEIGAATRQQIGRTLTRITGREVTGSWVRIQRVKASRSRVQLYASVGLSYYPFREENVRAMYDSVRALLPAAYRKARIELYTDGRLIEELVPLACRTVQSRKKRDRVVPFVNRSARPLVSPLDRRTPAQGLAGRHIALWQSHGCYFDQREGRWRWQRARFWQTCEDLYTQSYVLPYLVPMLENAGACVLLPRERDLQRYEVLADNDAVGEQYREENGDAGWSGGDVGFAHRQHVYLTGENPFLHGTTRHVRSITTGAESRAVWRVDIPRRGEYALYVSYDATPESADDALYTVRHLGGESRFAVNQTMGGGTWVYLGRFLFDAGMQEAVTLSNRSRRAGRIVSADAVKIGGGYGNVARAVADTLARPGGLYRAETSGYPRYCEGARYWLQWAGFDERVYTPKCDLDDYKDDFMSRALWVNALMGGSERLRDSAGLGIPLDLALAFHSDSGVRDGDETIGTLGIFFTRDKDGRFEGGADRYRSRDLTDLVMTQVVDDIRRSCEPEWHRRGLWNRSYYEARVPNVPTMLLELLSHQNFADMRYGNDPRFKFIVSRAVYKGILKHVAAQYDRPYVVQPLPVSSFEVRLAGEGRVVLAWEPTLDPLEPTAVPTGYMVYTRRGEGGFDNGRYTAEPRFEAEQEAGEVYAYRVTALNDGGESFPSETLAACHVPDERGCVLVVNGFNRVSAPLSMRSDSTAGFYPRIDAGVPYMQESSFVGEQYVYDLAEARNSDEKQALGASRSNPVTEVAAGNTFDYPLVHGRAIARAGYSFCSASADAVASYGIDAARFDVVDLILGKQRSTLFGRGVNGYDFKTFTADLQRAMAYYVLSGGTLFVSGSYVASDPTSGAEATDDDRTFVREVLHCELEQERASRSGVVRVVAPVPAFSRGDYEFCERPTETLYGVESPDALRPVGERSFAVMRYADTGLTAAVANDGERRTFVMGFPFETIRSEEQRERLMRDVLYFLHEEPRPLASE